MDKTLLQSELNVDNPIIDPTCFVAKNATVIGDVNIGKFSSVWYGSVLRGDINNIRIGKRTNIQDLTMVHVENDLNCSIGNDVTVGHRAILHACKIEDGVLIGMGAIILNGAHIKRGAVIAAGSVVTENKVIESNTLWAGVPARYIKTYSADKYDENLRWAKKYVGVANAHRSIINK